MAISTNCVWEVRTTGNANNGGGFVAGATGVDYSQQNAAQASTTAASVVHTSTDQINVNAGDHTVSANDVGNIIQITGGTATAGFYEILSVDVPNNRWTLDRSAGTAGQTVVSSMGGALDDWLGMWSIARTGQKVFMKAGTYTRTTSCPFPSVGYGTPPFRLVGYNTTRGDTPTGTNRPLIQLSTNSNLIAIHMGDGTCENIRIDCASLTNSSGIVCNNFSTYINCKVSNYGNVGFNVSNGAAYFCEVDGGSNQGFQISTGGSATYCWVHDTVGNFTGGFYITGAHAKLVKCIASDNTGAFRDGFYCSAYNITFINCISIGNGRHGINFDSGGGALNIGNIVNNCILMNNGAYGLNVPTNTAFTQQYDHNAYYNNTSGQKQGFGTTGANGVSPYTTTDITLTGDPFTNSAADDFSLNNTAGAGAACRETGWPGTIFPGGLVTDYTDVGTIQHQGGGGGGSSQHSAVF